MKRKFLIFWVGLAVTFCALAQPQLRIRQVGTNVVVSWPAAFFSHILQQKSNLTAVVWNSVTQTVNELGGTNTLLTGLASPENYFRLKTTTNGIYVDGLFGNDINAGAADAPVATIEQGIVLAAATNPKKDVYVSKGTYLPTGGTLQLGDGIRVLGQFDRAQGWLRSPTNATTISGGTTAVLANGLASGATIEGFTIQSAAPTNFGGSSYGIRVINSSVTIRSNIIYAAAGRSGSNGYGGVVGVPGGAGGGGGPGNCDLNTVGGSGGTGGASGCGRTGGAGGKGGNFGANAGANGTVGVGGTAAGNGGGGGDTGQPGSAGAAGNAGPNGVNGVIGTAFGTNSAGFYVPATSGAGSDGTPGNGGGGGGGGGGQGCTFCNDGPGNGGGGGGAGGCGGTNGGGAQGGGGSFGIFLVGAAGQIQGNIIYTGAGGGGGAGGNGGLGGGGGGFGAGATVCTGEVGAGGNGGRGGDGGTAGSGAGGAGGPSIGILQIQNSASLNGNQIFLQSAGSGGSGGANAVLGPAPAGPTGISSSQYSL